MPRSVECVARRDTPAAAKAERRNTGLGSASGVGDPRYKHIWTKYAAEQHAHTPRHRVTARDLSVPSIVHTARKSSTPVITGSIPLEHLTDHASQRSFVDRRGRTGSCVRRHTRHWAARPSIRPGTEGRAALRHSPSPTAPVSWPRWRERAPAPLARPPAPH